MNLRVLLVLLSSFVAFAAAPASAEIADKTADVASIESECGLQKGTITVIGDAIRLQPSPDLASDHIECALARLTKAGWGSIGFVGNEADPNAIVRTPFRYIASGSSAQIASLVKAAEADKWTVGMIAAGSDGLTFVQFESGATMTEGQASRLLDRIWKYEFGDIALGLAPRKLSDPFDD